MNTDVLIVGGGIAGCLLANECTKRGLKSVLIDEKGGRTSSLAAGGMINPVTGRKFIKSWMIDELLPFAKATYEQIEVDHSISLLKKYGIIRVARSVEQSNEIQSKLLAEEYQSYLTPLGSEELKELYAPIGGVRVLNSLLIDVELLVKTVHAAKKEAGHLMSEAFDYQSLAIDSKGFNYKGIHSSFMIFSEGIGVLNNPWFKYIPVQPTKGEILIVRIPGFSAKDSVIGHCSIIPWKEGTWYVGSTYDWRDPYSGVTEVVRSDLITRLTNTLKTDFEIVDHIHGIRPASRDRKPILGVHPSLKKMYCFNGLGTKGLSLGPYFASQLIDNILENKPILEEADIRRFIDRYEEA